MPWHACNCDYSKSTTRPAATDRPPGNQPQNNVARIQGESEHPIDFKINFNGAKGFAMVRVRYHNFTCEHDIFVRVGYEPAEIVSGSGVKWATSNVYRFEADGTPVYAYSPLQEGSLFRRNSLTAITSTGNQVNKSEVIPQA